jgi:hypothetical protein
MFRHTVVKSGGNGRRTKLSQSTRWRPTPSDGTSPESRCVLQPIMRMRSIPPDHANSNVRVQATICCKSPTLLRLHHIYSSRGLSARFEGGNILLLPEASSPSGCYVKDPGLLVQLIFLVTKRDGTLRPILGLQAPRSLQIQNAITAIGWWRGSKGKTVLHTTMLLSRI